MMLVIFQARVVVEPTTLVTLSISGMGCLHIRGRELFGVEFPEPFVKFWNQMEHEMECD